MPHLSGERHPNATISDAQVRELRQLWASWKAAGSRKGYCEIAYVFGISFSTARNIILGRTRGKA